MKYSILALAVGLTAWLTWTLGFRSEPPEAPPSLAPDVTLQPSSQGPEGREQPASESSLEAPAPPLGSAPQRSTAEGLRRLRARVAAAPALAGLRATWLAADAAATSAPTPHEILRSGSAMDCQGESVEVPANGKGFLLLQEAAGRWAAQQITPGDELYEVRLHFQFDLPVIVEDELGGVCPGEELRLMESPSKRVLATATTDSEGRARLIGPTSDDPERWEVGARVALQGVYRPKPELLLASVGLPSGPLRLVRPACGEIEVNVRKPGDRPWDDVEVALLTRADFDQSYARIDGHPTRRTEAGAVTYRSFSPGVELVAVALHPESNRPVRETFVAPGPGQRQRVELRFEAEGLRLLGVLQPPTPGMWSFRVFDPDSEARRSKPLQVEVDAAGHLALHIEQELQELLTPRAVLLGIRDGLLRLCVPIGTWRGDREVDLGDLALSEEPWIAGQVVDQAGQPQGQVDMDLYARHSGEALFARQPITRVTSDDQGRFQIVGPSLDCGLEWQVRPRPSQATLIEPSKVEPGDHGARIVVKALPVVRGRVLLSEALAQRADVASMMLPLVQDAQRRSTRSLSLRPGFEFLIQAPPDPFHLELHARWSRSALLQREDLKVADWTEEWLELDLRDARVIELHCVDPEGLPIEGACAYLQSEGPSARGSKTGADGRLALLLNQSSVDVGVGAEGYLDEPLHQLASDRSVTLQEAPRILLEWTGMPSLQDGQRLRPLLVPQGAKAKVNFETDIAFDAEGHARLSVPRLGRFDVHLQIERVEQGSKSARLLESTSPPELEVVAGGGTFPITWDKAAVEAALNEL